MDAVRVRGVRGGLSGRRVTKGSGTRRGWSRPFERWKPGASRTVNRRSRRYARCASTPAGTALGGPHVCRATMGRARPPARHRPGTHRLDGGARHRDRHRVGSGPRGPRHTRLRALRPGDRPDPARQRRLPDKRPATVHHRRGRPHLGQHRAVRRGHGLSGEGADPRYQRQRQQTPVPGHRADQPGERLPGERPLQHRHRLLQRQQSGDQPCAGHQSPPVARAAPPAELLGGASDRLRHPDVDVGGTGRLLDGGRDERERHPPADGQLSARRRGTRADRDSYRLPRRRPGRPDRRRLLDHHSDPQSGAKPAVAAGTAGGVWTPPGAPAPGQMPPPGGAGAYPPAPSAGGYPPASGGYPPPGTGYPPPADEAAPPAQPTPPPPGSPEPPPPPGKTL